MTHALIILMLPYNPSMAKKKKKEKQSKQKRRVLFKNEEMECIWHREQVRKTN